MSIPGQPPTCEPQVAQPPRGEGVESVPTLATLPGPDLRARCATPFEPVDFGLKGYHLNAVVAPDQVVAAATQLDREGMALDTITGVDWLAEQQMEVVYDYFHPVTGLRAVVRARIPRENAEIPSISRVFAGA